MTNSGRSQTADFSRHGHSLHVWSILTCLVVLAACGSGADGPSDADRVLGVGQQLFVSEGCVNCHGEDGQGVTAPALRDGSVIRTFPSCDQQLQWVSLGSARWQRDVGPTYGAQSKHVNGGMPGFGQRLDDEQLESVVAFTRAEFGGVDPSEAVSQCFG